jgi:hypothetical protein
MAEKFSRKWRLPRHFLGSFTCRKARHGTGGFTSPPKEGVLRIFLPEKSDDFGRDWTRELGYRRPLLDHRSRWSTEFKEHNLTSISRWLLNKSFVLETTELLQTNVRQRALHVLSSSADTPNTNRPMHLIFECTFTHLLNMIQRASKIRRKEKVKVAPWNVYAGAEGGRRERYSANLFVRNLGARRDGPSAPRRNHAEGT